MSASQVLAIEQPVPPADRILRGEDARPDVFAGGIVDGITQDRRHEQEHRDQADVEDARRGKRTGRKEERVARENRRHDQAGLRKHDQKEKAVEPGSVRRGDLREVLVEVEEEVDEIGHISSRGRANSALSHGPEADLDRRVYMFQNVPAAQQLRNYEPIIRAGRAVAFAR